MPTFLATLATLGAVAATLLCFLLGCQSWEHRRRTRNRLREPVRENPARVALIAPCKGIEPGLRDNLRRLFRQTHDNYEIVFVVESEHDPACQVILSLIAEHAQPRAKLVVAGLAELGCQKVHNLEAGVAAAGDAAEVLAFVDSDARPHAGWLSQLVQRLDDPGVGVSTGYRWFLPSTPTAAAAVLCNINATAASLYTPKTFQPVWGGSWAMRREVYEQIDLEGQWRGRLTDDLVATNVVLAAGLRVEFEPGCMVASPLEATWSTMFAFLRRQYIIGRLYARQWWSLALLATTVNVLGFWGGALAAAVGVLSEADWAWAPAAACLAWYAVSAGRAWIRRDLARLYLPPLLEVRMARVYRIDVWAAPVIAAINWIAIVTTVASRQMQWRDIQYELLPGGIARVISPAASSEQQQPRIARAA